MMNLDATSSESIGDGSGEICSDCGAPGRLVASAPRDWSGTAGPQYDVYRCSRCDTEWVRRSTP